MNFDYAIHSDFLIYWTGNDIDEKDDKGKLNWCKPNKDKSETTEKEIQLYLERFLDTLKFGLWMNKKVDPETIEVNGQKFEKPLVARTCFTELKLSEVRKHAKKFGRLGIGFKRYYLFDRLGAPMKYVQSRTQNLFFPPYSNSYDKNNPEYEKFSFYKHMCSGKPLTYDLLSESEWRIIYSENIKKKLKENNRKLFVDPKESNNKDLKRFYGNIQGEKPEYFLPLDGWFAMIIYPSLAIKKAAQKKDSDIQQQIKRIKDADDTERRNWPIEVDLDACRNF